MLEIVAIVVFILPIAGWVASLAQPEWVFTPRVMWLCVIVLIGILLFAKYAGAPQHG